MIKAKVYKVRSLHKIQTYHYQIFQPYNNDGKVIYSLIFINVAITEIPNEFNYATIFYN